MMQRIKHSPPSVCFQALPACGPKQSVLRLDCCMVRQQGSPPSSNASTHQQGPGKLTRIIAFHAGLPTAVLALAFLC